MKMMFKKGLRYGIGTLIFIPMSLFFIIIGWIIEDKMTMIGSVKQTWEDYKSFVNPKYDRIEGVGK